MIDFQWYSAEQLNCNATCSISTNGYVNGDYEWWIQGWNSVTESGSWLSQNFTVNVVP